MSLPSFDEIMSVLRDEAGVVNTPQEDSFFTNGMSPNLAEMIERVGSGNDFSADELALFERQGMAFSSVYAAERV